MALCLSRSLISYPGRRWETRASISGKASWSPSLVPRQGCKAKAVLREEGEQGEALLQDYKRAVKGQDLGKALILLEAMDTPPSSSSSSPSLLPPSEKDAAVAIDRPRPETWSILDTCLNALDLQLVGRTYGLLKMKGLLPNFGKAKNCVVDGPRNVTAEVLKQLIGLEASKLSPKKWGLEGASAFVTIALIASTSFLVNNNIEVRPIIALVLAVGIADAIYLGGTGLAQVMMLWAPYRRRVLVHEAGHILVAYLLGCPVRGVVLDALEALKSGIQGQAGTQFWDETLVEEMKQGRLSNVSFDRYCMVLFAGIAAEALVYGEAEGGENDENLFKVVVSMLRPPLSASQMSNQARWAVAQSYNLLKEHRKAHEAVVDVLEKGSSLGSIIQKIEEVLSTTAAVA